MKFKPKISEDVFGTPEWEMWTDDGHKTVVSIADLRSDGGGFVVYLNDDEWETADTFAEAKKIAENTP